MIDEKKVIKKLQDRIDDFVLKHPDRKDCEAVQTVEEFIQMLEEEAEKAQTASRNLFAGGGVTGDIPTTTYAKADLDEGKDILTLLVDTKLAASRGEARRLVQQGGVSVNGEKVVAIDKTFTTAEFNEEAALLIKKGKKSYHQIKAD